MTNPLSIRALSKRFKKVQAVVGLNLEVKTGTIHGLLGPNGSGKSTTLRCALGLLPPDSGDCQVLGEPASKLSRLRGKLGVAFDRPDLLEGVSVHANLEYARLLSSLEKGAHLDELLERVDLGQQRNQRAGTLSLGQKRRLAIARALLGKPEFLILDEPLSGLDTLGVRDMLRLFRELRDSGITLLLSSHRLTEMETIVDHVSIMANGKLVADESLQSLLAGRNRLEIIVSHESKAREILGARCLDSTKLPDELALLHVEAESTSPADVNAELVQSGCRVHALKSERASLLGVFEELVLANRDAPSATEVAP